MEIENNQKRNLFNKVLMIIYVFLNTFVPFAVMSLILYTGYFNNVDIPINIDVLFDIVFYSLMFYPAIFIIPSFKFSVKNFPKKKSKAIWYVSIFLLDFLIIWLFQGQRKYTDAIIQYSLNTYTVVLLVTIISIFIKGQAHFLRQKRMGEARGIISNSVIFLVFLIPVIVTYIAFLNLFLVGNKGVVWLYPFFYVGSTFYLSFLLSRDLLTKSDVRVMFLGKKN